MVGQGKRPLERAKYRNLGKTGRGSLGEGWETVPWLGGQFTSDSPERVGKTIGWWSLGHTKSQNQSVGFLWTERGPL